MSQDLKNVFLAFAGFGTRQMVSDMDGAKFSKLCKDSKLVVGSLTGADVDIIFSKAKAKAARKINFVEFNTALELIAEKKGLSYDAVVQRVINAAPSSATATQADFVKFHDDKSLYTGVYAKGGPTNIDKSKDLSALLDRSSADVRGVMHSGKFGA